MTVTALALLQHTMCTPATNVVVLLLNLRLLMGGGTYQHNISTRQLTIQLTKQVYVLLPLATAIHPQARSIVYTLQ
jgi:hypothetical protein